MKLLNFKYHNCINDNNQNEFDKIVNKIQDSDYKTDLLKFKFLKEVDDVVELENIKILSDRFKISFNNFCVIGTGGSVLGAQSLINLISGIQEKKIDFFYDIDPISFYQNLDTINLVKTGFIIISKSGSTPETMGQLGALLKRFEEKKLINLIKKNFVIITEDKKSPLTYIAKKFKISTLNHHKDIGGRFSVFSNVSLFPASLVGVNLINFRKGGKKILSDLLNNNDKKSIEGAAISILMHKMYNININVLFTYSDLLKSFGQWYRQLWSESIGKNECGTTPFHSIGTVDQHSQLQLFLDGPKDKFYTIIKTNHSDKGPIMHKAILKESGMEYLAGKKIGDLMEAEQNATSQTLINKKLPVREIFIKEINYESLGSLMMYYFLEVIFVGKILNIDIFNQPAVEEAKILTKKYLS